MQVHLDVDPGSPPGLPEQPLDLFMNRRDPIILRIVILLNLIEYFKQILCVERICRPASGASVSISLIRKTVFPTVIGQTGRQIEMRQIHIEPAFEIYMCFNDAESLRRISSRS